MTLNLSDALQPLESKALPLVNRTALWLYTFPDLVKPGPEDVLQSTLPLYILVMFSSALILWIVILVYFWKMIYYLVDDPYATIHGSAPPYERSIKSILPGNFYKILDYVNYFVEKFDSLEETS